MFDIQGGKEYFIAASDAFSVLDISSVLVQKKKKKSKPLKAVLCSLPIFFNKKIK